MDYKAQISSSNAGLQLREVIIDALIACWNEFMRVFEALKSHEILCEQSKK